MIIGAAKAGTTTLYDDLARHPCTFMPDLKEPDILHRADDAKAASALYRRHFEWAAQGQIRGEGSTYYTMAPTYPNVCALARQVCGPDLKIIYLMRDPMARIKSHLAHDFAVGRLTHTDFDRALREDPRYLSWSDYPSQIGPWLETFDRSCFLFLSFEAYVSDRRAGLEAVCAHLGIDASLAPKRTSISNARGSQRRMRLPLIGSLLNSEIYRERVRRILPRPVIKHAKDLLTSHVPSPKVNLDGLTAKRLVASFEGQREELLRLGIPTFPGDLELSDAPHVQRSKEKLR